MAHSLSSYHDIPNTSVSPMEQQFSSAMEINNMEATQQRQSYHGHTQYPDNQQQQRQPTARVRLPSFSSLISGTPDPLIRDYPRVYYNMSSQVECIPSSSNMPTASYPQRWSTPTIRSFQPISQSQTEPLYHEQPTVIDANESVAVAGSSVTAIFKPRRTRRSRFLSQVGTCVLNKRWTAKKDRNNQGSNLASKSHHSDQCNHRNTQQQDCNCRLSSTTDSSSTSSLLPTSSAVSIPSLAISSTSSSSSSVTKPRWQEAERLDLLKAIVKEKHLDDMTSFSWDRISLAVGRAKKACKDQWRREVLPALMEKLK